jgi:pyruvate,orthophosphate dikinase
MTTLTAAKTSESIKYVYDFAEGNQDMADLLGGKGAGLAEMSRLGFPVPPAVTITTEACRHYLQSQVQPAAADAEVEAQLSSLEALTGQQLGGVGDPLLLLSVRSDARSSMPGMMGTILDIGITDLCVEGLATQVGDEEFAFDSYRRLIQMFGRTVLGIDDLLFTNVLSTMRKHAGGHLTGTELRAVLKAFKQIVLDETARSSRRNRAGNSTGQSGRCSSRGTPIEQLCTASANT